MHLIQIGKCAYENAKSKGLYNREISMQERIAQQHSEVSEAFKAIRDGNIVTVMQDNSISEINSIADDAEFKQQFELNIKDSFEVEQADLIIRVCETSAAMGYNLDSFVTATMRYNSLRSYAGKAF